VIAQKPQLSRDLPALALMSIVLLATRAIWWGDPVADFDEQLYAFIGWRMNMGELPYIDWWDRKPFGLFALYALVHALPLAQPLGYQLLGSAFAMAGALLTYRLARHQLDRFGSAIAGALYLVLMAAYASYSGQSEVLFGPLTLGMALLLRDPLHPHFARRMLWAMLLGGMALQLKYTVMPQCAFFGIWALWHRWRAGTGAPRLAADALACIAIGLAPTALVALFYAFVGGLDAFVFANFLSFFDRVAAPQGRWIYAHFVGVMPLAILIGGGLLASRGRINFYVLWAMATLAGVLLPGTVYLYYYAAMAAPAVLVGLPLLKRPVPAVVLLLAGLWILALPQRYHESLAERAATARLAQAIAPHVDSANKCLLVFDGPTALYRMSGGCAPSRLVYPDHLNNALEAGALGLVQADEVARILATQPGAIVTASRPVTMQNQAAKALVEAAIARGYVQARAEELHGRTITAWVRRATRTGPRR
jgi:hypothetical protein